MDCIKNLILIFLLSIGSCSQSYAWDKSNSVGSPALDASAIFQVNTTTKASMPCPKMTLAERDLISAPVSGICIYDTTTDSFENYDGTVWKKMGGGLSTWETVTVYRIDDVVHESNKIYKALTDHTSTVFAVDLAANEWIEISDDLNRETSVTDTALVLWDGTGGDDVKDSSILVDGSSNITGVNDLTMTGALTSVGFNSDILDLLQVTTPSNPSASRDKLYFKSDDKLYKLTNGGVETEVGASVSFANDNRILRSDTIGSDNLQQSGITLNDTDDISGVNDIEALGTITVQTPTALDFKEVGEKYKGEENFFLRGQSDYGLVADWTGSNLTQDATASNFLTGEFSVWKWTDTTTISNDLVSAVIDIPKGLRSSDIGYQFRYKYDGDDDDIDTLIQCVDDSAFLVSDGEHKLEAFTETTGSAFASGEFAPAGCTQVKFIFKVAIANSGKELFFDSVKITPFNATTKKLQIKESYRIDGLTGHGSTNTVIPYYANQRTNTLNVSGTIANDSTNGFSFTAKTRTLITFTHVSDASGVALKNIGISLNSNQLTTSIVSIDNDDRLAVAIGTAGGYSVTVTWSGIMEAGDVIRPHLQDNYTHNNNAINSVSISTLTDSSTLVRKTNPNEVDSMIRFHTGNGHGSSSTKIRRFTNYTIDNSVAFASASAQTITTNAIECIDSSTLGLVCEVLSDGTYHISYTEVSSGGSILSAGLSLNSTELTTSIQSINADDRLSTLALIAGNFPGVSKWSGALKKGDKIRPHTDSNVESLDARATFTISKARVSPHVSIPIDDEFQNEFSARIANNGTATITSDNGSFIQSVNRSALGYVDVVFVAGFFTAIPAVGQNLESSGTFLSIHTLTTSGFTAEIRNHLGASGDFDFSFTLSRQGTGFKKKTGIVTGKFAATRTCIIEDRKSSVGGGTSTSTTVHTRTLNTANGDCEFLTLQNGTTGIGGTANQLDLVKGKYIINCSAPSYKSEQSQIHLYNTSDSTIDLTGTAGHTANAGNSATISLLSGNFTLIATKTFELRQFITVGSANGLGVTANHASNPATYDIFSKCEINKVR